MEIASTSRALHLFPTEQIIKIKRVGCKLIEFSDVSEISSRRCRNRKQEERYNVIPASKKRNTLCKEEEEEEAPNKRQKKTLEQNLTTKVCSVFQNPNETKTKPKVITKPNDEEEVEKQGCSLRDLVAKAKNKVQEKRKIDGRREYIARQRLEGRLAINQIVPTVVADDHLKYHSELEQLGCAFIHDQVICLTKFRSLSRSDRYIDESSSTSSVSEESIESSLEERKNSNCQSSTVERIQ